MQVDKCNDDLVEGIIKEFGVCENNILKSLSERQLKCWTAYALMGKSKEQILADYFPNSESLTVRSIDYMIKAAMLKIISQILDDTDMGEYFEDKPKVKQTIEEMYRSMSRTYRTKKIGMTEAVQLTL